MLGNGSGKSVARPQKSDPSQENSLGDDSLLATNFISNEFKSYALWGKNAVLGNGLGNSVARPQRSNRSQQNQLEDDLSLGKQMISNEFEGYAL